METSVYSCIIMFNLTMFICTKHRRRPKVALVLIEVVPKVFAHTGVLEVLEKRGIPVDGIIVGTSMGSIIGGEHTLSDIVRNN